MYKTTGVLTIVKDAKIVSGEDATKELKIREFSIDEVGGSFPNPLALQLMNEKCSQLDSLSVGDEVEVSFFIKGTKIMPTVENKYTEPKVFNNLNVYSVKKTNL